MLRDRGAEVVAVTDLDALPDAVSSLRPGSVDAYVQLPVYIKPEGDTVVSRVHSFLEHGLIARFTAAETVVPLLSDQARVVLVGGNTPRDPSSPDDQPARLSLLQVLAHALRADKAPHPVRVHVVDHERSAEQVASIALTGGPAQGEALRELAQREPDMSYEDWRTEVLGLVTVES
ncbi:MAG TPA: hypothetical protein VKP11_09205 [Frankiaceae bacterium]|nr:hypothetical protein [Frankiaceae bacterium]